MRSKCSVPNCNNPQAAFSLCTGHYTRLKNTGDPNPLKPLRSRNKYSVDSKRVFHGLTKTVEHATWRNMMARCYNKNSGCFESYGGRGITVCKRWRLSFLDFLQDMGQKPNPTYTIERIDNNGNYEPDNCAWASRSVQQRNTRKNRMVEFNGEKIPLPVLAEKLKVNYRALKNRFVTGWSTERAIKQPYQRRTKPQKI